MLLLIGYYLNVVSGRSSSESHGLPIAYIDLLQIDLDTAVLAGRNIVDYSVALPGILILLDLQVVRSTGYGSLLPNVPKCQCLIIAHIQSVDIGVLSLREPYKGSISLKNPSSENIHTAASSQAIITLRHSRNG